MFKIQTKKVNATKRPGRGCLLWLARIGIVALCLIFAGVAAGRLRILGQESSQALNGFVYWFALPPLLFLGEAVDFDALKLRNLREFEGW